MSEAIKPSHPERYHGLYRRLWSGAVSGKRINKVGEFAELVFWHANMIADDYGVFPAVPLQFSCAAFPLRQKTATPKRIGLALAELDKEKLIRRYEVEGEPLGIIVDFLDMQPAGRNGRRVSKFPLPNDFQMPSGESGGIQGNPRESGLHTNTNTNTTIPINTTTPTTTTSDKGTGSSDKGNGGVGGLVDVGGVGGGSGGNLAGTLTGIVRQAGRNGEGADMDRQLAVQSLLAQAGVSGDVNRELYQRKDITPDLVKRQIEAIRKTGNVDNPAAVLIHRLRNIGRPALVTGRATCS